MVGPENILNFWFQEIDSKFWFVKDDKFDEEIRTRFLETYEKIFTGIISDWSRTAQGRLAEIIVFDQFSRNMFRGSSRAFAGDPMALRLAKQGIQLGEDQKLPIEQRAFMYMPFMHSEDLKDHEIALQLFSQKGLESNYKYEVLHKNIIERFGRFPHRNQILGRVSTPEEIEFLKQPGSSF